MNRHLRIRVTAGSDHYADLFFPRDVVVVPVRSSDDERWDRVCLVYCGARIVIPVASKVLVEYLDGDLHEIAVAAFWRVDSTAENGGQALQNAIIAAERLAKKMEKLAEKQP